MCLLQAHGMLMFCEGNTLWREQVQLEKLLSSFQHVTDDMKQRFKVEGGLPLEDAIAGTPPASGHSRVTGFHIPIHQPPLASSAPSV